ncbi:ATP-dependent protease (CrgA), putative [Talaromyces stipitatus ATCC 10500]|uniref:ATP-dependent protease (CrgA), putative n=1 Tax=Talaromyces stipitatus (strain ATCC 10500 / CBS 375.48 / QM 6759 / NRRL 1006) TaxID=441959 RepID=B8M8L0_TALSN|nr:ATP-dependent protease (CrgA), putative [Talaromyces stipitatus ATCC 10500]EED20523.1 ATP-dependent protease (CrgA), putative [Talaromyces stipitatus ATCC 10500]
MLHRLRLDIHPRSGASSSSMSMIPYNERGQNSSQSADNPTDYGADNESLTPTETEDKATPAAERTSNSSKKYGIEPHSLIHPFQCPLCSLPLRVPFRLPCGKTICRSCLPPLKRREGITYLRGSGSDGRREEGFICPWKDKGCGNERVPAEHALDDCGVDVVLGRILDVFEKVVKDFEGEKQQGFDTDLCMRWKMTSVVSVTGDSHGIEVGNDDHPAEREYKATLRAGRYLGTYLLAREGRLPYDAKDVVYYDKDGVIVDEEKPLNDGPSTKLDEVIFEKLGNGIREELDCQVCYGLIIDPCISSCGHSFCYECVNRIRDNSNLCPLCRKKMYLSFREGSNPVHNVLRDLLNSLFPDEISSRREIIEDGAYDEDELPLFVCTLAFPSMPIYLHIFEPRYRLMIRRALDYGNSRFGMVIHYLYHGLDAQRFPDAPPQPFMQYGTAVKIEWRDFLPDGRIMLTAVGTHKFRVLRYDILDGYYRAHIERVDDISLAEEEALEARELAAAADTTNQQQSESSSLNDLSTQQLMQICMDFLEKQRTNSAPAVRDRVNRAFGQPPTDPAIFPYWFANVLPIPDEEAYKILPLTSVRERLKIAATWPHMLEASGWKYMELINSTGQYQPPPARSYDS